MESSKWIRFFDDEYHSFYYFNNQTQESQWEEPSEGFIDGDSEHRNDESRHLILDKMPLNPSLDKKSNSSLKSSLNSTSNSFDDLCYRRWVWVNAILVDAPFAALECLIRSLYLSFLLVIHLVYLIVTSKGKIRVFCDSNFSTLRDIAIEILISSVCFLSLLIPGFVLIVYKEFDGSFEWNLSPLPTLIGWVDPRRLLVFCLGVGRMARNRDMDRSHAASMDRIWCGLKESGSGIFCVPSRIWSRFSEFVQEEEVSPLPDQSRS